MTTTNDFVISRTFAAPRARVFRAWTDPAHLAQWMSPAGFKTLSANLDLRPGGTYHYGLEMPDGQAMWGKWTFREISAPERLVFLQHFSDANGGVTRHVFNPDWPLFTLATITFAEQGAQTLLTIRWSPYEANATELKTFCAGFASMDQGWGGTLDKLGEFFSKNSDATR